MRGSIIVALVGVVQAVAVSTAPKPETQIWSQNLGPTLFASPSCTLRLRGGGEGRRLGGGGPSKLLQKKTECSDDLQKHEMSQLSR
jgi:hypothetical protein